METQTSNEENIGLWMGVNRLLGGIRVRCYPRKAGYSNHNKMSAMLSYHRPFPT